ncbi:aspartokinase [Ascodesmis nigricans]|uniref:Aspartokinase n=1 Tax=Ascodesmis nigricans TaxID=341454 RepID=A0A4S2N5C3_9PEZI|nr:aspartokinase [Ascodesmis nigricans]
MKLRHNPPNAPWVIQKFGGTSIGKFAENIAEKIVRPGTAKDRIAIVCSARSTGTKDEGTTSRLLRAASSALSSTSNHVTVIDEIRADHNAAVASLIKSPHLRSSFSASVDAECARLLSFLSAAQVLDEISPKTQDVIIGAGEKLSCLFMTALLLDRGISAEYVNLENIIPTSVASNPALMLDQDFYESVGKSIYERIQDCGDRIPVVTGFFGTVPGSIITAIGRGYTDLCAALLAVASEARELQIWKEVDGIFTADPRKVPSAQLIPVITPEETAELTYRGSEVIHEMTMDHVIRHRIPIRIKNVMNPSGSGTVVFPNDTLDRAGAVPGSPARRQAACKTLRPRELRPTAVTTKHHITVINIRSNRKSHAHGFLASIFTTLNSYFIPVDLISTSEVHVSLAVHTESPIRAKAVRLAAEELKKYGSVDIIKGMTILAVIGAQMKNMTGIAGKIFKCLGEEGVNIEMISQGSDEINISCVVREEEAIKAMTVLHTRLFLYSGDD